MNCTKLVLEHAEAATNADDAWVKHGNISVYQKLNTEAEVTWLEAERARAALQVHRETHILVPVRN
ncbi:MAG: hypothetical protein ABI995_15455 [Acidobacteriota bacterium]